MGKIVDQVSGSGPVSGEAVRCPICGAANAAMRYCRHVRWTFDQGGPVEFARYALETSAYQHPRGYTVRDLPEAWWRAHEEWIVERALERFAAADGFVFGELADLDLLTLDIWRAYQPEAERRPIPRQ